MLLQWFQLKKAATLATPNYGYEKRQRELAKKQKKEDKARAKAQRQQDEANGIQRDVPDGDDAPGPQEQSEPGRPA